MIPKKKKRQNIGNSYIWDNNALRSSNYEHNGEYGYKVYFPLKEPVSTSTPKTWFKENYLQGVKDIYFKSAIKLTNAETSRDFVSGYAEIELKEDETNYSYYGMAQSTTSISGEYDLGYITLKPATVKGFNVASIKTHPFRKAALQHLRANRPELIYDNEIMASTGVDPNSNFLDYLINSVGSMTGMIDDLYQMILGFELYSISKGFAGEMHLHGHSVIRLLTPDGKKTASSTRVKRVTMTDEWTEGVLSSEYGQEYDYTIEEDGKIISSGVAYEPHIGKHESPLVYPVRYEYSKLFQGTQQLYVERPLMENHYPGASIGYRKVTVKSIAPENKKAEDNSSNQLKGAAPLTEYEFYTPKDFPVKVLYTDLDKAGPGIEFFFVPGIYTSMSKRKAATQGYVMVKNDMAGKMKAVHHKTLPTSSNPNGVLISETEYIYNVDNNGDLDPNVRVIRSDGSYETGKIGESFDIIVEFNENSDNHSSFQIDMNLVGGNLTLGFPLPIPVPSNWADMETSLKTVVLQKIVQQSGILMKTIVRDGQATITTENLAFDEFTGEAIITKVNNEFKDDIYAYKQKARWFSEYESMNAAYENVGITYVKGGGQELWYNDNTGELGMNSGQPNHLFKLGDEIVIHGANSVTRAFVTEIVTNRRVKILGDNGLLPQIPYKYNVTIVRSGNKNLLMAEAGGISAMEISDPFTASSGTFIFDKVLNSSAVKFKNSWQTAHASSTPVVNPYVEGMMGTWRPWKTYAFLGERVYDTNKSGKGIRGDGVFTTFTPFDWNASATNPDWQVAGEVTKYSPFGFEVENKVFDKQHNQHIYSAALYGYKNSLVTAVASNARYQEIAMDNFEDYYAGNIKDGKSHLSFETSIDNVNIKLDTTEGHTGNQSLEVESNQAASTGQINMITYNTEDCTSANPYAPECTCLGNLALQEGKKYIISAWVKGDRTEQYEDATYSTALLKVKFYDANGATIQTMSIPPKGKIIDDWQRIWGEIPVPTGASAIEMELENTNNNEAAYFDDIRIQPLKSGMTTYVYYRDNLKLAAQMDGNNHATIYIYNEEGKLIKVKKETEEGIKTLQEGRQHVVENN